MDFADAARPLAWPEVTHRVDRIGERSVGRSADGAVVETFTVCADLSERPEFCAAVAGTGASTERPSRSLIRLIGVEASPVTGPALRLRQEWLEGERLDEVASRRRSEGRPFSLAHVLFVLSDACAALRAVHARGSGACHGAMTLSRLLVTTDDRLVVCEHVLGPGLAALSMPAEWFAERLGLAVPRIAGIPLFTPLTDQLQLAYALVELLGGDPQGLAGPDARGIVAALRIADSHDTASALGDDLRLVLERMLLLSPEGPYRSMTALERAVEAVAAAHPESVPAPPPVMPAPPPEAAAPAPAAPPPFTISATGAGVAGASFAPALRSPLDDAPQSGPTEPAPLRLVDPLPPPPSDVVPPPAGVSASGLGLASASGEPDPGEPLAGFGVAGEAAPGLFGWEQLWEERTPVTAPDRVVSYPAQPRLRGSWRLWALLAAATAVALAGGWWLTTGWHRGPSTPSGWLRLESKPAGATVTIDGEARGQTPLTLSVPAGAYSVEFTLGGEHRALTVPVTAQGEAFQLVSLYPAGPPGVVSFTSVPAGATVTLNDRVRGRTPLELRDVPPGEHTLRIENDAARTERTVEVLAGARVEVSVPLSGSVLVESPFEVSVSDGARSLGRTTRGILGVSTGLRRLTFSNTMLNYEETREVEVAAGMLATVTLRPPTGVLNLDADTQAQVLLDGRPLGLTPLANVTVSLGTHEVVFRDSVGGEVRYVIVVALGPAYRLRATLQNKVPPRPPGARRR